MCHIYYNICTCHIYSLKRLEILADKFNRKAQSIEGWTTGKDEELKQNDDLEEANLAGIQVTTIRNY